jgi:hypothetical protein
MKVNQDSGCHGRDSNRKPPEYEATALLLDQPVLIVSE